MKKPLILALAIIMLFSLSACGEKPTEASPELTPEIMPEPIPEYVPTPSPESTPEPERSSDPENTSEYEIPVFDDVATWKSQQLLGLNVKYPSSIDDFFYDGEDGHYFTLELTLIERASILRVNAMTAFFETFSEELDTVDLNEYKEQIETEFDGVDDYFMELTSFMDRTGLYCSFTFELEGTRFSVERILFSDDETDYDIMFFCPTEIFDDCVKLYYQVLDELTWNT